jgi:putative tricarboxylic transport membrane protein
MSIGRFLPGREVAAAVVILGFAVGTFAQTFSIDDFGSVSVGPAFWPRVLSVVLFALGLGYLARALKSRDGPPRGADTLRSIAARHRNPAVVFLVFAAFLLTLKGLGMLVGLTLFCFVAMTALGGRDARSLAIHAAVSVIAVGIVWITFTYGLGRMFPLGTLTGLR